MVAFVGLDIGTQGARAVSWADSSREAAQGSTAHIALPATCAGQPASAFPLHTVQFPAGTAIAGLPAGHIEQWPGGWWEAACACLRQITHQIPARSIHAVSVTSTSGTICLLDSEGDPLLPALMYNDARAKSEADEVQKAGADLANRMGYRFNSSFALAKLLWLARHREDVLRRARHIVHAADFLTGRLTGNYDVTDFSNALKTGYDLAPDDGVPGRFGHRWPDFIGAKLGLPVEKLPRVIEPGEIIGKVTPEAAQATGLHPGTLVAAGMTDGCASQIAAGAVAPGDWNSTLGTTLVIKGVTAQLLRDDQGRIYSHRHPDGYWLPGGASNVGGAILANQFPGADLVALDRSALQLSPTDWVAYPLEGRGERFPFVRPDAEGFMLPLSGQGIPGGAPDPETQYTAYLEGIAYVERLAYEMLEGLGAHVGDRIYAAGSCARSDAWLQMRADVLGRAFVRPAEPGAAMGAAILAASRTHYGGVIEAARAMVQLEQRLEPRPAFRGRYGEGYRCFRAACSERGYI